MPFTIETNPKAKLTFVQVRVIKTQLKKGISGIELAKEYNVHPSTISRIKRNMTWREENEINN